MAVYPAASSEAVPQDYSLAYDGGGVTAFSTVWSFPSLEIQVSASGTMFFEVIPPSIEIAVDMDARSDFGIGSRAIMSLPQPEPSPESGQVVDFDFSEYKSVEIYSDVNSWTPEDAAKVIDIDAVYQSVDNILFTLNNERLFHPEFGADLEALLFELMDEITAYKIFNYVVSAITVWEPRVEIIRNLSDVTPVPDENKYLVILTFRIIGLEDQSFEIQRYLDRRTS